MEENKIVKYEGGIIKRISNQIGVTNKLLALSEPKLIPYRKGSKCGFCTPDKKIVIDCIYDDAFLFSEGLAAVFINGKNGFGFINEAGLLVIPFFFESAKEFTEGLAAVKNNNKWGYVNRKGEIVIPFSFDRANRFSCGLAKITDNQSEYFIDKNGDLDLTIFTKMYERNIMFDVKDTEKIKLRMMSKENWLKTLQKLENLHNRSVCASDFINAKALLGIDGVPCSITTSGDLTLLPFDARFDFTLWYYFEGILSDGSNFLDSQGNILHEFDEYDTYGQFYEGLLNVSSRRTRKWGFVDKTGKNIIPCVYDDVDHFFKGFAKVEFHGKYGYINKEKIEYWEE